MKCDISSFVVEANNYLVDVCSQLVLIYAPLLASFKGVDGHQAIKEEEQGKIETETPPSQSLSKIFYEAYDVQCHVDGCTLSVAYYANNAGSDVQVNEMNHG